MAFYLSSRKLDVAGGDEMIAILNEQDAKENGVNIGDKLTLEIPGRKKLLVVNVDASDSLVEQGEIGFFENVWDKYHLRFGEVVKVKIAPKSDAIEYIRKKLKGEKLSYEEIYSIIKDIADDRLGQILTTYYAAAGYSPGFDEEEMFYMTKAMAETGDTLKFDGIVADKHSIGGVAGKGITPLLIPMVACVEDLTLPNTSSRAVTSASATTDMLETVMPMIFAKEELEAMILKHNSFMVWGGGLELAPADDEIIEVQKPIGIESIDKFVASIVSKKVAQGVTHVVFDVPMGKGAKITGEKEFRKVNDAFNRVCKKFDIKVLVHRRDVKGIDGNAVGPTLEAREFLRVYERDDRRSLQLEKDAVNMAGGLIELCGKAKKGEGSAIARKFLENGQAFEKFKTIVELQGGSRDVSSNTLEVGGITWDYLSPKEGVIDYVNNKKVFEVCRALGNPQIKEAGMYFHKKAGTKVKKGEKIFTLYATTDSRLKLAQKIVKEVDILEII